MNSPTVLVMTGDKLRHRYFAAHILQRVENSMLLVEKQAPEPWGSHAKAPSPLVQRHFQSFQAAEQRYFAAEVAASEELCSERTFLEIEDGEINSSRVVNDIERLNPRLLVVLSTSLLKADLIRRFPRRIINLHAGLSPHYRGTGTNVFPFYNDELEYVGMTIHYIDEGIDSGDIITQCRPIFEAGDTTHSIGCKNVIVATQRMIAVIDAFLRNAPPPGRRQDLGVGRVYYKKDFTDDVIVKIEENIASGMVERYLRRQPAPVDMVESSADA